jgi:hypothetical protein
MKDFIPVQLKDELKELFICRNNITVNNELNFILKKKRKKTKFIIYNYIITITYTYIINIIIIT